MATIKDIVVDCAHPDAVAQFWAAVLDGYAVVPDDRAAGIDDAPDEATMLIEAGPGRPRLFFVPLPEPRTDKNRLHLDLRADDPAAEVIRLVGLGARVIAEHDARTVLEDPEGNEFCLLT